MLNKTLSLSCVTPSSCNKGAGSIRHTNELRWSCVDIVNSNLHLSPRVFFYGVTEKKNIFDFNKITFFCLNSCHPQ